MRTIFNFVTQQFEYNEALSPERNAAYLAWVSTNAYIKGSVTAPVGNIGGVRTSSARYTRTTGVNVAGDVGKYVLSYDTDVPTTYGWHKLSAVAGNGSYFDIDATYGTSGGFNANIDQVIIFTNDETDSMAAAEAMLSFVKV